MDQKTPYDADIILKFANRLYALANSIIFTMTFVGGLLGGGLGFLLGDYGNRLALVLGGAVVCGLIGLAVGRAKAFVLKLHAQTALCQMQIEQNTRS